MLDMARIGDEGQKRTAPHGMMRHMTQNSDLQILMLLQRAGFSDARVIESRKILFGTVRTACFCGSRGSR